MIFQFIFLLSALATASDLHKYFPFSAVDWGGSRLHSTHELWEAMKNVPDAIKAHELRQAVAAVNPDADVFLGYALGEAITPDEWARAEKLFQVEHPFYGPLIEAWDVKEPTKWLMGVLVAAGLTLPDIVTVRKAMSGLPASACQRIVVEVLNLTQLSLENIMSWVKVEQADCDGLLSGPKH